MQKHTRAVGGIVLACLLAAGCTEKFKAHLKEKASQMQRTSDDTNGNPCSLLDSNDVAAAIGPSRDRRLAVIRFRTRQVRPAATTRRTIVAFGSMWIGRAEQWR